MQTLLYLILFSICTSSVYTEQCDLLKLSLLPGVPDTVAAASDCNAKTNIQLLLPSKPLSTEEHQILCEQCPSLIDEVVKLNLPNCTLVVSNLTDYGNATLSGVIEKAVEKCNSLKKTSGTLDGSKDKGTIEDTTNDSNANMVFVYSTTLIQLLLIALLALVIAN